MVEKSKNNTSIHYTKEVPDSIEAIYNNPEIIKVFDYVYVKDNLSIVFDKVCYIVYSLSTLKKDFNIDDVIDLYKKTFIDDVCLDKPEFHDIILRIKSLIEKIHFQIISINIDNYIYSWSFDLEISFSKFMILIIISKLIESGLYKNFELHIYDEIEKMYTSKEIVINEKFIPIVRKEIIRNSKKVKDYSMENNRYHVVLWDLFIELSKRMSKSVFYDNAVRRKMDIDITDRFYNEIISSLKVINIFFNGQILTEFTPEDEEAYIEYNFTNIFSEMTASKLDILNNMGVKIYNIDSKYFTQVKNIRYLYNHRYYPQGKEVFDSRENVLEALSNYQDVEEPKIYRDIKAVLYACYKLGADDYLKTETIKEYLLSCPYCECDMGKISYFNSIIRISFSKLGTIFNKNILKVKSDGKYKKFKIIFPEEISNINFSQFYFLYEVGKCYKYRSDEKVKNILREAYNKHLNLDEEKNVKDGSIKIIPVGERMIINNNNGFMDIKNGIVVVIANSVSYTILPREGKSKIVFKVDEEKQIEILEGCISYNL